MGLFDIFSTKKTNHSPAEEPGYFAMDVYPQMTDTGSVSIEVDNTTQPAANPTSKTKAILFGLSAAFVMVGGGIAGYLLTQRSESATTPVDDNCSTNITNGTLVLSHGKDTFYSNISGSGSNYIAPNMTVLANLSCNVLLCAAGWAMAETKAFFNNINPVGHSLCTDPNTKPNMTDICEKAAERNYTVPACAEPKKPCETIFSQVVVARSKSKCITYSAQNYDVLYNENDTMNGQEGFYFNTSGEMTSDVWELKVVPKM